MSYKEYYDMYENAQKHGKYRMYIIDVKNSRSIENILDLYLEIKNKMDCITSYINEKLGILHTNDHPVYNGNNYFQIGDLFGFVTKNEQKMIIEKIIKKEFDEMDLHYNTGLYETDEWSEGNNKYYFGYCIQQLEADSKEDKIKLNKDEFLR